MIAPNFSLFRDVPRFDNLANIKRSLLCAEELSTAGLSVIPYIAGITERLWGDLEPADLATAGRVLGIVLDRANAELAVAS